MQSILVWLGATLNGPANARRTLRGVPITIVWPIACGYLVTAAATCYCVIAWLAARKPVRVPCLDRVGSPKITVLKPLCGAEPETYECLRSYCDQDYPEFQVLFAVAEADDPVIAIVARLQREFQGRDLQLIVDRRQHGSSRKISNLINLMASVRHEYLVLADSDVRVKRDYLRNIVLPLLDPEVGIVTCPYSGVSRRGLCSLLGSMFINEWFMPSVQIAARGGSRAFAFGATIAMRREVLTRVGGFSAIANHLADDYRLGKLTRELGLRTVLSDVVVEVAVQEASFKALVQHELRWLRTIRAVRPVAYSFCFVTFGVPVAFIGTLMTRGSPIASSMLAISLICRLLLHVEMRKPRNSSWQVLVVPIRDSLSLGLWLWSFMTRQVRWRDERFRVFRDGSAIPVENVNL
jgi:ceramide glucosyltransferase